MGCHHNCRYAKKHRSAQLTLPCSDLSLTLIHLRMTSRKPTGLWPCGGILIDHTTGRIQQKPQRCSKQLKMLMITSWSLVDGLHVDFFYLLSLHAILSNAYCAECT